MKKVPCLNLSHMDGSPEQKKVFIEELRRAYTEFGFCSFTHHGLDFDRVVDGRKAFEQFFALPIEEKKKCYLKEAGGRRGYTPMNVETAKDAQIADIKEFFHIGRETFEISQHLQDIKTNSVWAEAMIPNIWPERLPQFRYHALALYDNFEKVGRVILRAMALALGGHENDIWPITIDGNSILRALHYPGLSGDENPAAIRAAAHEDAGLITILLGASAGGLEILSQGEWIPVAPEGDAIVVNVGDMLQRMTNHVFPSTTHRVVNPEGNDRRKPRYSLPFFMDPRPNVILETLPYTISEQRPDQYPEGVLAHDFLMQRMRDIKLQK